MTICTSNRIGGDLMYDEYVQVIQKDSGRQASCSLFSLSLSLLAIHVVSALLLLFFMEVIVLEHWT